MGQLIDAHGKEVLQMRFQRSKEEKKQTPLCYAITHGCNQR